MVMWQLILVVIIASILGIKSHDVAARAVVDPCLSDNHQNLTDVHRSVSFVTAYPEVPLCDDNLVSGWYRFVVDAESKMPEACVDNMHCGTAVPIWMNGTHPSVSDGIQTRQTCANFQTAGASSIPCCAQAVNIGVKNCDGFFVYYLHPTPVCPVAYCAGKDMPCPAGKWSTTGFPPGCKEAYPQLTDPPSFSGPVTDQDSFHFSCDLTYAGVDPDQAFEFAWLFDGVEAPRVPSQIVNGTGRSAKLDGSKLTGLLNKNIGCKVRAFYQLNPNANKGPWLESPQTYWAGIRTEPSYIHIATEDDKKDVVILSTLPLLCESRQYPPEQCCLVMYLAVGGPGGDRDRLEVGQDCKYSLCGSQWNSTLQEASVTVSVAASRKQIQDGNKDLLLSFAKIFVAIPSPYLQIFSAVLIPSVQVDIEQRDSKLCNIVTDPHITGLEDKRTFHLYLPGDYTAYENPQRHFEVQIRTWPCYHERPDRAVTCICGVAAREKDDLIRIDGCDKSYYHQNIGSPQITMARPVREGTRIFQSTDGSEMTVYFPSGSEIKITAAASLGGHLNLDISVPASDYLGGRGLCGTFDNNPNNELTHRSGYVDTMPADYVPEAFTESWKCDGRTSLFRTDPLLLGEQYESHYCTCIENGAGVVNCSVYARWNLQCNHCGDVTDKNFTDGTWTSTAGKRSARSNVYVDSDQTHHVYDPDDYADFRPPKLSWPTSSGITESQAETYCSNALNQSQLWSHCQDKTQEIRGLIDNCKIDIQVADDYIGMQPIVNAFLTICQVDLAKDPNNYVSTPDGQSVMKQEISDDVCNPVCYINGNCTRGLCVCKTGFTGDNCQIKDEPPQLHNIRGSRLCDINQRPCQKIFINASNIQSKDTMGCKVQEILDDGSLSRTFSMEEAIFVTLNKLVCFLPDAGIKTEKSMRRFYITATIDGKRYSNALNITIYDSSCQNCTEEGCRRLPNTCLINNLCYQDRDLNPKDNSQICTVSLSTTEWSTVPTVPSDYPVITSVNLTRTQARAFLRCVVNADDSKSTASFRMSWGLDGDWTREFVMVKGHLEADIHMHDVSHAHEVVCRVRSLYTDRGIFSPYVVSRPFSPLRWWMR